MTAQVERIGEATLYLGDCLEIVPGLPPAEAVVTDPPYGMNYRPRARAYEHVTIANDNDAGHLIWACRLPARHSKYVFARWNSIALVPPPRSMVVWVKNNWSMGDLEHEHARQTEVSLFYPGPEHHFPKSRPADVIECPRSGNAHHPTEKPVPLLQVIVDWTIGTVLDPFMGSGTTGVACARLGRPFVGIELERRHFEVACRRIEEAYRQGDLLRSGPPPKLKQGKLF